MITKLARQQAQHMTLGLLKTLRSMTEPKPPERVLSQARYAQREIDNIVRTLTPNDGEAQIEPIDLSARDAMHNLDEVLRDLLLPNGYLLLVFSFGDDAWINYTTNANEDDACELMRTLIKALEKPVGPGPST